MNIARIDTTEQKRGSRALFRLKPWQYLAAVLLAGLAYVLRPRRARAARVGRARRIRQFAS